MAEFKQLLRRLRKLRGWSQEQLARAIDLSREQVSRLESGVNRPQQGTIEQIAEVFGLPAERLTVDAMEKENIDDFVTIAKLHRESQRVKGEAPTGLGQFQQFVVWFRAMNPNDQSLTLAALQKIHEDSVKASHTLTSKKKSATSH